MNDEQARVAKAYIAQLDSAHVFHAPVVTTIEPGKTFYRAEAYHQDFLGQESGLPVHRLQRPAEDRQSEAAVPRALPPDPVLVSASRS